MRARRGAGVHSTSRSTCCGCIASEPLDHGRAQALVAVAQRLALQRPQAPGQPAPLAGGRAGVGQRGDVDHGQVVAPGQRVEQGRRTPALVDQRGRGDDQGLGREGRGGEVRIPFQAAVANTWVSIRVSSSRYGPPWPLPG